MKEEVINRIRKIIRIAYIIRAANSSDSATVPEYGRIFTTVPEYDLYVTDAQIVRISLQMVRK